MPQKRKPSSIFKLVIYQTAKNITSSGMYQTYISHSALPTQSLGEKNRYPSKSVGGLQEAGIGLFGLDFGPDSMQSSHVFIATPTRNTARPHGHNLNLLLPPYPTATIPSTTACPGTAASPPSHPPPNPSASPG